MSDDVKTTGAAKKTAPKKTAPVKGATETKATAPAKKAAAKKVAEPKAEKAPRVSKWMDPTLKLLAQHPDGLTRSQIWEALETQDLGGVLVNNPDLFASEAQEGVQGKVFKLTKAGAKKAASFE